MQARLGLTFVIVTHDQDEAMSMAGRIGVMNRGRLVQVGPPAEVYERPATRWVADFIGDVNLIEGRVAADGVRLRGVKGEAGGRCAAAPAAGIRNRRHGLARGPAGEGRHRPRCGAGDADNAAAGTVVDIGYLGDVSVYRVRLDNGVDMRATAANRPRARRPDLSRGDRVLADLSPSAAMVLTR